MGLVKSEAIELGTSTIPIAAIATGTPDGTKFVRDDGTLAVPAGGGNSFGVIAVSGQSNVVADTSADTLTLAAGANITLTTDASTDTVTLAAAGPLLCVPIHADATANVTLTNQAVAEQFLGNSNRNITRYDLTGYTDARLVARVVTGSASVNSPRIRLLYDLVSGGFSTTIGNYTNAANSGEVACSLTTAGVIDSGWVALASAAKADVYLAVTQIGGDATADPALGLVTLYVR